MKKKILTLALVTLMTLAQALPVSASAVVIEDESTYQTELEWSKPSTWEVVIPELTTEYLNSVPVATGDVLVTADLLGGYALKVTTNPVVTMTQAGKSDVLADVTMSKKIWSFDEAAETPVPSTVTMTARGKISSGEYKGTLTYTVELINDPVCMMSNAKYYLATAASYRDDRSTYPFPILQTRYSGSTTDRCYPSPGISTIWTATGFNSGNNSYYKYLDTKLTALGTNYSAKDVVVIAPKTEYNYLYNHPAQYPWWDTTGIYTEIGGVNSSLQTDIIATINLVLNKQTALGIDAPVVFIQCQPYGDIDHKNRINNAYADPNVQAALAQDNVIYIKEADFLVASDYYQYSTNTNDSGNLKLANAIEAALLQYYSR